MGSRDLPDMSALALGRCAPSGSCVHIRQITPAHVTYITCVLMQFCYFRHLNIFHNILLILFYVVPCPEITLFPMNNTIIVEEEALFTCEAFSFSKVDYKWERQNDKLPDKAMSDTCSSILTIPNGTQFDEGNYCCVASNECGPVKECAMLSVIGMDDIIIIVYVRML